MHYDGSTATLERPSDIERNPAGVVKRWLLELKLADKREDKWRAKAEKVLKRYRQQDAQKHSFNILWANTETLRPAVYNSLPKPDVRRRFKDEDPLGKCAAETLSRSLEYGLDVNDFTSQVVAVVLDMLLPGRGVARVRYVPSLQQVGVTPETHVESNETHQPGGETLEGDSEELAWEQAPLEHVQWDDFRIGAGKEWSEVQWVGFRHRLTREELEAQFPECGSEVELDSTDDDDIKRENDPSIQDAFKTAEVWEIWFKEERKVLFISQGYKSRPLKVLNDPLNLIDFWPIPRPIYAIEDSASLVPVPLFELYKEQADELDQITYRINKIVKGLKFRGIYDETISALSELMRGEDNDLIPSGGVTALLDRGGLQNAIWFLPIEQCAMVLKELYIEREACKQIIYELTGISDILRGSTNANETAAAQSIKAQWGSNRLKRMQGEVARFIRDVLRLQAEIIGEKFQQETLMTMTGLKYPTMADKQQMMAQHQQAAQMAQMQGQPPPQAPDNKPTWEEVIQVLRDDKLRTFKIDVETDSTVAASIETDMNALRDVLTAVVQVVQGFGPAVQMGAMPVEAVKEIVLAVTRRAKLGNAVEDALDKIKQPPPPQQPQDNTAEIAKIKAQQEDEAHKREMQMRQQEMNQEAALEQQRNAMEQAREEARQHMEMVMESQRMENDQRMAELTAHVEQQTKMLLAYMDRITKLEVAEISAQTTLTAQQEEAAEEASDASV